VIWLAGNTLKLCSFPDEEQRSYTVYLLYSLHHTMTVYCTAVLVEGLIFLLCNRQRWRSDVKCFAKARTCCLFKPDNALHVMVICKGTIVNAVRNCMQNNYSKTSTLLEQPLLLYIIVTLVWSECDIFVCSVCTGNWCIFSLCVLCAQGTGAYLLGLLCVKIVTLPGCIFCQLIIT